MYSIGKRFTFSAAHHLDGLKEGHKCAHVHGHTYTVEIVLVADTLENGMVRDFGDMVDMRDYIKRTLDHKNLNDVMEQPTVENIAKFIFDAVAWCSERRERLESVKVWEGSTSWGLYSK